MLSIRKEQIDAFAASLNRPAVMPCERHWIEIVLIDEAGQPVPDAEYRIRTPDGTVVSGQLDGDGKARVDNIVAGNCSVTFPSLDASAWRKAAAGA